MTTNGEISALAQKVIDRCRTLANFTEEPGRTTRTFLSAPMRDCHNEIRSWLVPLGIKVSIDAIGNLRAIAPEEKALPRLLIGSHLDTVPNAGAYDGILGVVLGVALMELNWRKELPFGIELIGLSEEEGVRFSKPFFGSRALVGTLDDACLNLRDANGVDVRTAVAQFGLDPSGIPSAPITEDVLGFLEFHIEQGPVLDELGLPLAAVEAIAGQSRLEFTFNGKANHAGTTPMRLRQDAVAAAAEWISAVERGAVETDGLVATVGRIFALPGATNVIAGCARLSLDVRHRDDQIRQNAVAGLIEAAKDICTRRRLAVEHKLLMDQKAVAMDDCLTRQVAEAIDLAGCTPHRMVSGAGHDAMIMAETFPTAMMFLRSPGGISHSPDESVRVEDVERAIVAGAKFLELVASSSALKRRTLV